MRHNKLPPTIYRKFIDLPHYLKQYDTVAPKKQYGYSAYFDRLFADFVIKLLDFAFEL
ncbi:MAG: hypothetical protein WCA35_28115 [Kovacikia sp.]